MLNAGGSSNSSICPIPASDPLIRNCTVRFAFLYGTLMRLRSLVHSFHVGRIRSNV